MLRAILGASFVLAAMLAPLHVQSAPFALKSIHVVLPDSTRMFPGPGADAINNNCRSCHSAGMVLNQPDLTQAAWKGEVAKMINVFKAPVAPEDVGAIVDYLTRTKGKK